LIVILKNSYDGKLKIENKIFKTTKTFKSGHGIGLKSAKIAVKKYQGDLELEHTPNYFIARVILPVEK
ncbi:MAG: GHKL domain-containing protein, partial [Lachnospirales bacterium]